MPRRTGQPTLTDERRKWDAKILLARYSGRYESQSSVKAWRAVFQDSEANANSARAMWGERVRWFRENCPGESKMFNWMTLTPEWMWPRGLKRPPRRQLPRGRTEREKRTIAQATSIIIHYCIFRMPLEACWRMADPKSPAKPNSARILAQRKATEFIRKYPGAAQLILDNTFEAGQARRRTRSTPEVAD